MPTRKWRPFDCKHESMSLQSSAYGIQKKFVQPEMAKIMRATQPSGRLSTGIKLPTTSTFPAPLVLPGDELSYDPRDPPQSFGSWFKGEHRNAVTDDRKTIYVALPPMTDKKVKHVDEWIKPNVEPADSDLPKRACGLLDENLVAYLEAFYYGMPVKVLPRQTYQFVEWQENKKTTKRKAKTAVEPPIGLNIGSEVIHVRTRPSGDDIFPGQLNLNDLLDAAIGSLPEDAYALLMLTQHDLYEDDDDDFCCGRAYGGSRVAVVSMARYNPAIDTALEVERNHAWPASHCRHYVQACCEEATDSKPAKKRTKMDTLPEEIDSKGAMSAALTAYQGLVHPSNPEELGLLWLGRVCKTASHELGHCFGIAHCVYAACIMQGTANLSEDARQPSYLCPVDLAKVLSATGGDCKARYRAMIAFCERWDSDRMFSAFAAWLNVRIAELETGTVP